MDPPRFAREAVSDWLNRDRLLEQGYVLQKFFPAELAGGIPYLRAVWAPLPEVRFVPSGGISAKLALDYLALEYVAAVGAPGLHQDR